MMSIGVSIFPDKPPRVNRERAVAALRVHLLGGP